MTDDGERAGAAQESEAIACPFCGFLGVNIYFRHGGTEASRITGDGTWVLECNVCQCTGPIRMGRRDWGARIRPMLLEAWNDQKAAKRADQAEAERERLSRRVFELERKVLSADPGLCSSCYGTGDITIIAGDDEWREECQDCNGRGRT